MLCVDFLLGQGFERKWRETVAFALPIYYQMGCFPQEDYQIWQLRDFHQQTWLLTLVFTFDFYSTTSTTAKNTYSAHPNFTVIQWTESHYCNCVSTLNIHKGSPGIPKIVPMVTSKGPGWCHHNVSMFSMDFFKGNCSKTTMFLPQNMSQSTVDIRPSLVRFFDCPMKNMDMMRHLLWDWHGTFCGFI